MKYTVTLRDRTVTVDLTGGTVVVDGRSVEARLHAVPGTPLRQLVLPDGAVTFVMERVEDGWAVRHHGETFEAGVIDERTRLLREMTGVPTHGAREEIVKAPMPGLVLRVEVEEGQPVEAGQALVVLEAMKMENEIRAHAPGVVRAVRVAAGAAVERGAALIEIAPPEA